MTKQSITWRPWFTAAVIAGALALESFAYAAESTIQRVTEMPDAPKPYAMRDWHQVTRDYLDFVFDFDKKGQHLPLFRWQDDNKRMIWMPAYVGNPDGPEGINYLAAVVSGSLVGLDMRSYRGHDWVAIGTNFFNPRDGIFLDWPKAESGGSFWYDVFPNVLYYQLGDLYPDEPASKTLMRTVAERWYDASVALGGGTNSKSLPNFDHTGFDLRKMQPFNNGKRIEPEGAAGIAWIEYMAWKQFKDPRFLNAADGAIRALEQKPVKANPLYEVLLPYAAFTAARMNAELGSNYDVPKLVNWCFDPYPRPQARPNWGVITGSWSGLGVHGLVGSVTDGGGYAFAMNTFQYAGTLAPLVRYDDRYARDMGKWLLNAANASRLFYPNAHDAAHQSSHAWTSQYDSNSVIAYEGLRKWKRSSSATARADFKTAAGRVVRGDYTATHYYREKPHAVELLEEGPAGKGARLDHIWTFELPEESERFLAIAVGEVKNPRGQNEFRFSYATRPNGPYTEAFTVNHPGTPDFVELPRSLKGKLYVRLESTDDSPGAAGSIEVDAMAISYRSDIGPYAQGDLIVSFVALVKNSTVPIVLYRPEDVVTDLGLYGSSHVGNFGGLLKATDVEKILQVDLLRTDYFREPAYPTFLYYNPHATEKSVEVDAGTAPIDIYDSVANAFVLRGVHGKAQLKLPAGGARVVVFCPANGELTKQNSRTLVNGVVIDYRSEEK